VPLIEEPKTEIILPIKSAGMITDIDTGDGESKSIIMVSGPKYGPGPLEESGGLLNKEQSDRFVNLLKKANDKMLPKTKWAVMTDTLEPKGHDTIEEALRHRHSAPKGADPSVSIEKHIAQSLTEAVQKDIDKTILKDTLPFIPQMRMLRMPHPIYGSDKAKFAAPREPYETIEEALRMRHRKPEMVTLDTISALHFTKKNVKVQAFPRKTKFFPLLDESIDKLWVK
jgi:hypothetical protein